MGWIAFTNPATGATRVLGDLPFQVKTDDKGNVADASSKAKLRNLIEGNNDPRDGMGDRD